MMGPEFDLAGKGDNAQCEIGLAGLTGMSALISRYRLHDDLSVLILIAKHMASGFLVVTFAENH